MAMMHDGMGQMGQWMNVWAVFWVIFGLLLIALAVAALVWMIRSMSDNRRPDARDRSGREDVVHELELRYARGELSREDYLQRRSDLQR